MSLTSSISLNLRALRLTWKSGKLRTRRLRKIRKFLLDRQQFVAAGGQIDLDRPMLEDLSDQAGAASGHYFHQDLLVATKINERNPEKHVDVGSRIDGFVAHVASFRDIEVFDIRPLAKTPHIRMKFIQGDLMAPNGVPHDYCDSLSCLHALEHFGLGRYGDPIDPQGHIQGFKNLTKLLKPRGTLYISFPIGRNEIQFNAHRIFSPTEILTWTKDLFDLLEFHYVDDAGDLHLNANPNSTPQLSYGCGIYIFQKRI